MTDGHSDASVAVPEVSCRGPHLAFADPAGPRNFAPYLSDAHVKCAASSSRAVVASS